MRLILLVAVLGSSTVVAEADPLDQLDSHARDRFAIAVSTPVSWVETGFGASLYYKLAEHHALRFNVASYSNQEPIAGELLIGAAFGGDDDGGGMTGRTSDVGVGWMYFPRRFGSGFFLETGVLGRLRRVGSYDEENDLTTTRSSVLATRALVGWSWPLFGDGFFVSIAAGASAGYEWGATNTVFDSEEMPTAARVSKLDVEFECFSRLGFSFGG